MKLRVAKRVVRRMNPNDSSRTAFRALRRWIRHLRRRGWFAHLPLFYQRLAVRLEREGAEARRR